MGFTMPKPEGRPSVLMIVLDDTGFGQLGCFGSTIDTPNIDRLAAEGLRFNRFHVTAMCSPTRAAALTGRNAHRVGMGFVADIPLDHPGYTGRIPPTAATIARHLTDEGYATRAVGKWHLVPRYERSDAGPFDNWPLGQGFERFYGFLQGDTNQWRPSLVEDNHLLDHPTSWSEGYHLTEDLVDRAIRDITGVAQAAPGKPTFTYLAFGAMHAPHHVPREWADRYAGAFDEGWEAWRDTIIERQRSMGLIPEDSTITPRPQWVDEWSALYPAEQRLFARQQEVFAGFLSHTDHHIGRLLDSLERLGRLDDTIVMLFSDNGTSPEGGRIGSHNEHRFTSKVREDLDDNLAALDDWGGPSTYNHYAWGWAWAGNAPFHLWKRFTWLGGTRTPLIIRHPATISDPGAIRSQLLHAVDLAPTILEMTGTAAASEVAGVKQMSFDGVSAVEVLKHADAGDPRSTQYFELFGSRSIIHDGFKATTDHVPEGLLDEEERLVGSRDFADDHWSLFDLSTDFAESRDISSERPELVARLAEVWQQEAERNGVLPLFDSLAGRFASMLGPVWPTGQRVELVEEGGPTHDEALPLLFGGFTVTAEISTPGRNGVVAALGDRHGGFALFLNDGILTGTLATPGGRTELSATQSPVGSASSLSLAYRPTDGGNLALLIDGKVVATVSQPAAVPVAFQHGGAQLRIGHDAGFPVSDAYEPPASFDGKIEKVIVDASQQTALSMDQLIQVAFHGD